MIDKEELPEDRGVDNRRERHVNHDQLSQYRIVLQLLAQMGFVVDLKGDVTKPVDNRTKKVRESHHIDLTPPTQYSFGKLRLYGVAQSEKSPGFKVITINAQEVKRYKTIASLTAINRSADAVLHATQGVTPSGDSKVNNNMMVAVLDSLHLEKSRAIFVPETDGSDWWVNVWLLEQSFHSNGIHIGDQTYVGLRFRTITEQSGDRSKMLHGNIELLKIPPILAP